jgi:hypothetical protein
LPVELEDPVSTDLVWKLFPLRGDGGRAKIHFLFSHENDGAQIF